MSERVVINLAEERLRRGIQKIREPETEYHRKVSAYRYHCERARELGEELGLSRVPHELGSRAVRDEVSSDDTKSSKGTSNED